MQSVKKQNREQGAEGLTITYPQTIHRMSENATMQVEAAASTGLEAAASSTVCLALINSWEMQR